MEIDPAEVNKNVDVDIPLLGNVKKTIPILTKHILKKTHESWISKFKLFDKIEHEKVINEDLFPTKDGLTMGEVVKIINEETNGDAVIVTDVGQHQMVACRYARFNKSKSNITSGGLGTMGFALPAALGAKMVHQQRSYCNYWRWRISNDNSRAWYYLSNRSSCQNCGS